MDVQEIRAIGEHGIDSQPLQIRDVCDSGRRQEQAIAIHNFAVFLINTIQHFGDLVKLVPYLPLELGTCE